MDGLSRGDDKIFILAASNLPWDLDNALLRRLEKRVGYLSLPARFMYLCLQRREEKL